MIYEIIQHRVLVIEQHHVLLMLGWTREQGILLIVSDFLHKAQTLLLN